MTSFLVRDIGVFHDFYRSDGFSRSALKIFSRSFQHGKHPAAAKRRQITGNSRKSWSSVITRSTLSDLLLMRYSDVRPPQWAYAK